MRRDFLEAGGARRRQRDPRPSLKNHLGKIHAIKTLLTPQCTAAVLAAAGPRSMKCRFLLQLAAWMSLPLGALATENGTTAFPNGAEDFLVAGMPPPGWYGWVYYNHYQSNFLADNSGRMPVQSFDLKVNAVSLRLDWVRPVSILGADRWGTLLFLPVVDLNLALSPVPGVSFKRSKTGLGDITLGNGLHWTFKNFEMLNAVDVAVPVGAYDKNDLVNPGQNRWVVRLNHMGTWHPTPAWDVSYRLMWDYNFNNPATDYHSGQTVYLNWALGWKPTPPLTVGVAGYFLRQITDDRQRGQVVGSNGNRVRVDAIGPCVKYFLPNHVMLTAKYFREFDVRNHPRGDVFWFSVAVPFGRKSPPGH